MIIRTGNYTLYNGVKLQLFEERYEGPIPEDEKLYNMCYNATGNLQLVGFELHPFEELYCKRALTKDIDNAFFVQTFGLYKRIKVKVFNYKPDSGSVYITTEEKIALDMYSFLDQGNFYGKDIKVEELEKIWEERKVSQYGLPLPTGLELYKEIKL